MTEFNRIRKFYLKIAAALFAVILIQIVWDIIPDWKIQLWISCLICSALALLPRAGKYPHAFYQAYRRRLSDGMAFFQGAGLLLVLIGVYRLCYGIGNDDPGNPAPILTLPPGDYVYFGAAGLTLLLCGIARKAADLLFSLWMKAAEFLRIVMSRILLTLVYILGLLPAGLLARVAGKKFLSGGPDPRAQTYWIDRGEISEDPRRYKRIF